MRWAGVMTALGVAAAGLPALAHHSIAAIYDREKTLEIQGVLSKIEVQNPHSMLELMVTGADGKPAVWMLEGRGVQGMNRIGFEAPAVAVGDKVTVKGFASREGAQKLWLQNLQTSKGKSFDFTFRGPASFNVP